MGMEIERKFLVGDDAWRTLAGKGCLYRQGYLANTDKVAIRIRVAGSEAWLTVKSADAGLSRMEFEYGIPVTDAEALLRELSAGARIEKTRYVVMHEHMKWEIDEFHGENDGLVMAEVELCTEVDDIAIPDWVGEEVTGDKRYYNAELAETPYRQWK